MITRRHLRIKVLLSLYAFFQSQGGSISEREKELQHSVRKFYELYILLLNLLVELKHVAELKIEANRNKKLPTKEDLNPSSKFIHNKILHYLENNLALKKITNEMIQRSPQ